MWAAARPRPDLEVVAEAATTADLAQVLEVARLQRVGPLVLRALEAAGVPLPDGDPARREAAFRRGQELVSLPLLVERALVPLESAGLRPLLYKGGGLVGRYPEPGLRPMDDVDVLLPSEQVADAVSVLQRAGWRIGAHSATLPELEDEYDIPLVHPETGGLPLELHHKLHRDRQRTNELDAAGLWAERIPASVCGHPAWGMPPELELLALVTHAAKPFHVFSRLIWAVDLVVVIEHAEIDWDDVSSRAEASRCRNALAVGLSFARRLGASVPDHLLELRGLARGRNVVGPVLDPTWPFIVQTRNRRGFALALVDDRRARARLMIDQLGGRPGQRSRGRAARAMVAASARTLGRMVRGR